MPRQQPKAQGGTASSKVERSLALALTLTLTLTLHLTPTPTLPLTQATPRSTGASTGAEKYWKHSAWPVLEHGELFAELSGAEPHVYPPRWPQPEDFERGDNFARFLLLHFPRFGGTHYFDPVTGHAVDQTLLVVERAVQALYPNVDLKFAHMFDYVGDLYDGGAPLGFGFKQDFYEALSDDDQSAWRASKVALLAAVFVDEMVQRQRVGAFVLIAGVDPTEFWPALLAEALPIALKAAEQLLGRPAAFEIKYLTDLPALEEGPGGEAAPVLRQAWELTHPSTAYTTMPRDMSARWDEALAQLFGRPSVPYFARLKKKHGNHNAVELRMLQAHAKACHRSLTLPLPLTPNP